MVIVGIADSSDMGVYEVVVASVLDARSAIVSHSYNEAGWETFFNMPYVAIIIVIRERPSII